jgi:hypothetical protein
MSDIKLPGVGNVPKPALIAAGAAALGIVAYAWYKHKSSGSSTPDTSTDPSLSDSSIDPATGVPYADEFGASNGGYGYLGVNDPTTGTVIGSGVGTQVVTQATTNASWAQASQAYLTTYGGYQDSSAVAAALGAGLLGHYMTPDQIGIWNSAVAFEGDPPQGHPPLNTTPPTGQPPAQTTLPAPAGFKTTGHTSHSVSLSWSPLAGALEYHIKIKGGGYDHTVVTHNTSYAFGNLSHSTTYSFYVMGQNGAGTGAPSKTISVKTSAK